MRLFSSVLLLCAVIVLSQGCHKETEQDKVRKIVTNIQKASEDRDASKIIGHLSRKYADPQGFTYDTIRGLLLGYFLRHQRISTYLTGLEVSVDNNAAAAVFQAILTGHAQPGNAAGLLPEALGMYSFDVAFSRESGEWKIVSAKWERMADQGGGKP